MNPFGMDEWIKYWDGWMNRWVVKMWDGITDVK